MMEDEDFEPRRPRSRNWNTAEKFFLFEHVKNRFDIITDPRKESASINAKRRVWEQIYQAIAKEFGPLEEHLVRGKGGEKCRTQWKNLVQAARKEYKQYMEAKMVGKRHNMTLLSRKICRLMSIDLDDGMGEDNEENDWTEDHPEFRYQPELCQELKETARRINEEYAQGIYDTPVTLEETQLDFEEEGSFEAEIHSDSEADPRDDEKDEDYAPSAKRTPRKRRRASSGRSSSSRSQPTRTSARAQAAQVKKQQEEEKKAKKRRAQQEESALAAVSGAGEFQMGGLVATLDDQTQQEILNLHLVEHKKRLNLMNTEHKTKMQNLKMEKDIMNLQKEYWSKKLELLHESSQGKGLGEDDDDNEEDEDEDMEGYDEEEDRRRSQMSTAEPNAPPPSAPTTAAAPTSVVVPPVSTAPHPPEPAPPQPTQEAINDDARSNNDAGDSLPPEDDPPAHQAPPQAPENPPPPPGPGPAGGGAGAGAGEGYMSTPNHDTALVSPQNQVPE